MQNDVLLFIPKCPFSNCPYFDLECVNYNSSLAKKMWWFYLEPEVLLAASERGVNVLDGQGSSFLQKVVIKI